MLLLLMSAASSQAIELSGHCQTKLRVHKEFPDGRMNMLVLDIAIEFLDNKQMLLFIEGSTSLEGKDYTLSRYVNYAYKKEGNDFYELQRKTTETLHADNYPGDDFTEQFGIEVEHPKFHISRFYNNYIFANQFAPVFICITS
ncbi:hypothetical protein [Serratia marcescens]|uniref:hypothetical protein n=1 Tax=Serratia marcescens TaxID=615 RepID=UPI0016532D3D|nr:hypothetical protein [Serratia marcescens]